MASYSESRLYNQQRTSIHPSNQRTTSCSASAQSTHIRTPPTPSIASLSYAPSSNTRPHLPPAPGARCRWQPFEAHAHASIPHSQQPAAHRRHQALGARGKGAGVGGRDGFVHQRMVLVRESGAQELKEPVRVARAAVHGRAACTQHPSQRAAAYHQGPALHMSTDKSVAPASTACTASRKPHPPTARQCWQLGMVKHVHHHSTSADLAGKLCVVRLVAPAPHVTDPPIVTCTAGPRHAQQGGGWAGGKKPISQPNAHPPCSSAAGW